MVTVIDQHAKLRLKKKAKGKFKDDISVKLCLKLFKTNIFAALLVV